MSKLTKEEREKEFEKEFERLSTILYKPPLPHPIQFIPPNGKWEVCALKKRQINKMSKF
jgi:hypothetical protein